MIQREVRASLHTFSGWQEKMYPSRVQSSLMKVEKPFPLHRTKPPCEPSDILLPFLPCRAALEPSPRGQDTFTTSRCNFSLSQETNQGWQCWQLPEKTSKSHFAFAKFFQVEKALPSNTNPIALPIFRELPDAPERQLLETLAAEALKFTLREVLNFVHVVIYCNSEKLNPAFL